MNIFEVAAVVSIALFFIIIALCLLSTTSPGKCKECGSWHTRVKMEDWLVDKAGNCYSTSVIMTCSACGHMSRRYEINSPTDL